MMRFFPSISNPFDVEASSWAVEIEADSIVINHSNDHIP